MDRARVAVASGSIAVVGYAASAAALLWMGHPAWAVWAQRGGLVGLAVAFASTATASHRTAWSAPLLLLALTAIPVLYLAWVLDAVPDAAALTHFSLGVLVAGIVLVWSGLPAPADHRRVPRAAPLLVGGLLACSALAIRTI